MTGADSGKTPPIGRDVFAALAVLVSALGLSACIQILQAVFPSQNEKAVLATGILFAGILMLAPGIYLLRLRAKAQPETAGLAFLAACSIILLAVYFFLVRWYVVFPADIWIWSEGDFVNDILKFSVGYPLYTAPSNGDSFHYPPGAQLLTYLLAWVAGKGDSIPAYRAIQLIYTTLAAFVALLCCRRILRLTWPSAAAGRNWLWTVFWFATLLLMATNSITNRFAHNLHGDALSQLLNVVAFYLLLAYIEMPRRRLLAAMVLLVPIGVLVKQNMLIWGVFYAAFLALWGRSIRRTTIFSLSTAVLLAAVAWAGYAKWGRPFLYWVFVEMGRHAISPLRAFQHVLDSWPYFAAGLLGGMGVLRGRKADGLTGAWLISLGLLAVEAYTSGIEWMLNHLGPGCLLAGVWFLAGLASFWNGGTQARQSPRLEDWIRAAAVVASIALIFSGMGLVRIPLRPVSDDAYRYVRDIEREFQGQPNGQVLLDTGTWVYQRNHTIMGDRATSVGTQAMGVGRDDFSGFLSRIANKRYSKILVRDLHAPDCWYENSLWPKQTGVRAALLENYRETGRIRAADGPKDVKNWAEDPHLFSEITILQPKDSPAPK